MLKAQQDLDDNVRKLWETVADTLDFMKQADWFDSISGFEKTVQAIIKQIYDCVLFLRSYGDRGFMGKAIFCSVLPHGTYKYLQPGPLETHSQ